MFLVTVIYVQLVVCLGQYIHDEDTDQLFPDWEIFYSPLDLLPTTKYLTTIRNCECRVCPYVKTMCIGSDCTTIPKELIVDTPLLKFLLTSIAVIQKDDFINFSNNTAMEIESNVNLYKIEAGVFRNMKNLRNLTIASNKNLKYLDENVFEGLVNVEILCISKNGFIQVYDITRACSPNFLPRVKLLSIAENRFHEIKYNDFYPMNGSNLKQLNLILCQIEVIHPECLKPLKHLQHLRLCQNLFNRTTLTNFIIRTLDLGINLNILNLFQIGLRRKSPNILLEALGKSNLTYLILAGNDFNNIDNGWFPNMPKLTNLDMRFCSIIDLDDNAFRPLTNLQNLLLSGNKLAMVPNAITVPKYLKTFDISRNFYDDQSSVLFYVPENIFKNSSHMTYLKLSYNNIGFLSKTTVAGLTNLYKLVIKNASLSYIENNTFSSMKKLRFLELTNNPLLALSPLTANTFSGLTNLNVLLLGGCGIQNLSSTPSIFIHIKNLTSLVLEKNGLTTISSNQLIDLRNLSELQLNDNKMTTWSKRILPSANLTVLNAQNNRFSYVTPEMLEDFQTVRYLRLDNNPFRCDCNWYKAGLWLKSNKMSVITSETENVAECDGPEKWRGKSVVNYVRYLKHNLEEECKQALELYYIIIPSLLIILLLIIGFLLYWFRWYIRYWIFLSKINSRKNKSWTRGMKRDENYSYEYDAFVSYSIDDRAWIQEMIKTLEPDLRLCTFERDFPAGASISQAILQAVVASRRTILVVSESFAKSHWCRWETQLAEFHQLFFHGDSDAGPDDTLIIVRLQTVPSKYITPTLRFLMSTRIYLQWPSDASKQLEFWEKLKITLSSAKSAIKGD